MAAIEHALTVNRPVEEVFAYLTNVRNLPEWQKGVTEARPEGEIGVGARFTEVRTFLGKRIESTMEVVEHEPARLFTIRVVKGPIPFEVRHTFRSEDAGTRIQIAGSGEPGGFFKLADGLVARQAQKAAEKDFARLKTLLEARG
jgi:ligand-binding SRPBCC domain-containing protein